MTIYILFGLALGGMLTCMVGWFLTGQMVKELLDEQSRLLDRIQARDLTEYHRLQDEPSPPRSERKFRTLSDPSGLVRASVPIE